MSKSLCSKQNLLTGGASLDRSQYLPTAVINAFTNNINSEGSINEFIFNNNSSITQWQQSSTQVNGQYMGTNQVNLVIDNGFGNWPNANFGISFAEMCPCESDNSTNCPSSVFQQMANAEGPMGNDGLSNYRFMYCTQNNPPDIYDCNTVFQDTFFNKTQNAASPSDFTVFGSLVGNYPPENSKLFLIGEPIPLDQDQGNLPQPFINPNNTKLTHMQLYYLTTPSDGGVAQPCANSLDENTFTGEGSIGRVFQFSPEFGACSMRNVCANGTCQGDFPAKPGDNPYPSQAGVGPKCYTRTVQQSDSSFPIEMFGPLNSPTGLNGDPNFINGANVPVNISNPLLLPFGNDSRKPANTPQGTFNRDIWANVYNKVPEGYYYWDIDTNLKQIGNWDANYQGVPFASVSHVNLLYDNPYSTNPIEQWVGPQWSYDVSGAGYNPSTQIVSSGAEDGTDQGRAVRQFCGSMYGNMGAGGFCTGINYTNFNPSNIRGGEGNQSYTNTPGNNVDFFNCTMPTTVYIESANQTLQSAVDCSSSDDFKSCLNSVNPWLYPYVMYNPQQSNLPVDQNVYKNATLLSPYFTHSGALDYYGWTNTPEYQVSSSAAALQAFWPMSFRGNAGITNPPGYDPKNANNANDPWIQKYYNGSNVCSDNSSGDFECPCIEDGASCSYTGYFNGNRLPS